MRSGTGVILGSVAAVSVMALVPARAAAPVTMEKGLLGIRILQTYKDVLARLGQPKVMVTLNETASVEDAVDPNGNDLGGIRSVSYGGSSSGSAGGGSATKGGGGMGMPGLGPMGPMTGGGGGGMMGMGKKGDGGGVGAPGPSMPGGAGGGSGAGASSGSGSTFGESGGYSWWYHNARQQVAYSFLFNADGRVRGIMERGREGGTPTQRGIHLGSALKDLYTTYGWPDTIEEISPGFVLDYGSKYHAKFAVIKDKVVGIGVVLAEDQHVPFFVDGGGSGGGGATGGKGAGAVGGGAPTKGGGGFAPRNPGGVGGASSHAD